MAEEPTPSTVEGLSPCGGGSEVGPAVSDYNNNAIHYRQSRIHTVLLELSS